MRKLFGFAYEEINCYQLIN